MNQFHISKRLYALLVATCLCGVNVSVAQTKHINPNDDISNVNELPFNEVEVNKRELDETFVRDGVVADPERFAAIRSGVSAMAVREQLGSPIHIRNDKGQVWDYNFKFRMPASNNYLVCQYEVIFKDGTEVIETVWRRRQCEAIAKGIKE